MTHHNIDDMVYDMTRARAQAVSDVQAENEERRRRQRVEDENRAAYDEARAAERNRRGGSVSSMNQWGPDGGVASSFSNTTIGPDGSVQREGFGDAWGLQARVGSEFADLARRSAMAQRHNAQIGTDSLSAAMRAAMANGGRLPQNLVGMLSRNLGMDGKSASVFSAGYLNNGDFDIDIVTRGANGGLQRTTKKISPREQLGIVNSTPGVWGNDGLAVSQRLYDGLRNTMGKSELPPQGVYADNLRAYNTKRESAEMQKFLISCAQEAIKAASRADPKSGTRVDPKTAFLQRALLNDKVRAEITQGTEPELDKDGNPVIGDDGNQVMKPASDEVQRSRLEDLANRAFMFFQGGQGGPQGGRVEAQMQVVNQILNRLYPPTPPDVAAFQQGQRERQMREVEEAQAREDITRRPQQVINYFKDGKWYSGNGYIRDGKVYDGQGYEIEGATPAEMARGADGGVYSNERGWVARALPSARELVSGRGGAAQGAQVGAGQPEQPATQQAQQPAQGAQSAQQAQGTAQKTAQVEAQSKDKPVPPPDGKQTTEHNNKKYEWKWVSSQNRWAYAPIESAEQKRVKEEASMIRDLRAHGGKYNEDDDGNVSVRIADFDYLPDEDKAKLGSDTLDRIDGEVVFYQAKAKESRRAFQQRREAELARLRDVAAADRSLRTATKRQKWVDEKMREWDIENDPTLQRKAVRQSSEMSDSLMNAL